MGFSNLEMFLNKQNNDHKYDLGPSAGGHTVKKCSGSMKHSHSDADSGNSRLWEHSIRLDASTFRNQVINDPYNAWFIAFMDPHCAGCLRLVPEWEKVRSGSIGDQINIKFGFVDISNKQNKSILDNYSGGRADMLTPTVLFYGKDKYQPIEYSGKHK